VALKAKQRANPEEYRRRQRVSRLRTTYGVSVEQFEQMEAAQGGVCNLAIGALGDTSEMLERAIAYLRGIRA
jgi:hypothetical protein